MEMGLYGTGTHIYEFVGRLAYQILMVVLTRSYMSGWDNSEKNSYFPLAGIYVSMTVQSYPSPEELRHRLCRETSAKPQIILLQPSVSVDQGDCGKKQTQFSARDISNAVFWVLRK